MRPRRRDSFSSAPELSWTLRLDTRIAGDCAKIVAPAAKGEETLIERADVDLGGSSFKAAQSVDKPKH